MNKSNISKVINKMKMFLPLSMLWIGAVPSGYLSDIDLKSQTPTKSYENEKAPSFFSLFDIFSICYQPTTDKNDLNIEELPRVNHPLKVLGNSLIRKEQLSFFRNNEDIFPIGDYAI